MHIAPHHAAWLAAHPDRDVAWLKARIADGFEVHHIDGEHLNNEPGNLVLIERLDHGRLHDLGLSLAKELVKRPRVGAKKAQALAPEATALRDQGLPWREVGRRLGISGLTARRIGRAA